MITPDQFLVGSFIFRNQGDGCLLSKYVNNIALDPYVEACKMIPGEPLGNPFEGRYTSVWIEDNGVRLDCVLIISTIPNNRYELQWRDRQGRSLYEGIGMLFESLLVGSYWRV